MDRHKKCYVFCYRDIFILVAVSLYCLHLLRNISQIFAVMAPLFSLCGAFLFFSPNKRLDRSGFVILLFFLVSSILPVAYSIFWFPDENYQLPLVRFFYVLPFFIFCLFVVDNKKSVCLVLKVYSFYIALASITLFYQTVWGPISWFADASEREGLVRFSSLVGSLTAFGIFSIFALPIIFLIFENLWLKIVLSLLVIGGGLISLQKAAIVNFIIITLLIFFFENKKIKINILISLLVVALILLASYFFNLNYIVATVDNILRIREGAGQSDVAVFQSLLDRLWGLPSVLFSAYGESGLLLGVGLVGGSGTFGFSDYPMSHNGFFDLLFLGGLPYFLTFCLIISFVFFRILTSWKIVEKSEDLKFLKLSLYILILFILNFAFAGALYYQPYGGVVFYSLVTYFCLHVNEIRNGTV